MRVGGLASGMDTDSIVKEMMAVQKMPLDKLMQKKAFTEWQQEAFRDTNLAFSNLEDSAGNLRLQSSFNSYTAASSNGGSFTVSPNTNAVNGTYKVKVDSVASPAKLHSATAIEKAPDVKAQSSDLIQITGTATITVKDKDGAAIGEPIEINDEMTYKKVAQALQDSTAGQSTELRVSFDDTTSRFFISTKGMGADQNFSLEFSSPELANQVINNGGTTVTTVPLPADTTETAPVFVTSATNGKVTFDGIEIGGLTSNKTTVNGLTLDLKQAAGVESIVTVSSDPGKPLEMIKSFVEEYNKTISEVEKQLVEKRYPDFQPLSDEQKKDMSENEIELWEEKARSGLLRNDPLLKSAIQDLRRAFMDEVEEIPTGNINLLSQIGINTGTWSEGSKLFIDEKKLTEVLTNQPDEVMQLFTNKGAEGEGLGIGDKVYSQLKEITKSLGDQAGSTSGPVDNSTISKKIRQMNDDISRWQDRLTRIEDRYWKQFTAMEKALSQMNSQSTWMQQNLFGGM